MWAEDETLDEGALVDDDETIVDKDEEDALVVDDEDTTVDLLKVEEL